MFAIIGAAISAVTTGFKKSNQLIAQGNVDIVNYDNAMGYYNNIDEILKTKAETLSDRKTETNSLLIVGAAVVALFLIFKK